MSVESNITYAHGWHANEAKTFALTVLDESGAPINLSLIAALQWRLLKHGRALLTKATGDGISVSGASNNIANVAIAVADYGDEIVPGSFRHELWDRTNDRLFTYGTALLQPGSAE